MLCPGFKLKIRTVACGISVLPQNGVKARSIPDGDAIFPRGAEGILIGRFPLTGRLSEFQDCIFECCIVRRRYEQEKANDPAVVKSPRCAGLGGRDLDAVPASDGR